jgi:phospholipid/cholesterol/gamma-HCH transport system substrate-binding protein
MRWANITQGAKVAVFVVVLGVAAFMVRRMIDKGSVGAGGYHVFTHLGDASGLVVNSRVRIAGIPVGTIESITLDRGTAKITLRIDKGVDLHLNATAAKRSASLLGEYVMVLTPGTEDQAKIPDGGEIANAVDAASTDKILADVAVIAEKVKIVSTQLADSLGTEQANKNIKDILKNLADTSKQIDETVKENRRAVTQSITNVEKITNQSIPKINGILTNVESVTGDFRDLLESERGKVRGGDSGMASVRDTLDRVNEASKSLDSTLRHTDSIMARIDRGEGTVGRLTRDDTLITDVEGVVSDVREITGGISRVQTIVGLRSEYLIKTNGLKSFVELRLQPREDKYYLIELISDPRGSTSITQTDVSSTNPNNPPFYRQTTTSTTQDFRLSFMFARRLGPATFLFGIRESTGGVGLYLHAFDDHLELQSDLFGFGENIRPHWRERLQYEFVRRLWVTLGVDDILNPDRLDYFFGAMLRFNDEDLKTILPFASIKP